MKYTVEESLADFNFWSGARDTVEELTESDLERIESYLEGMDIEWTDVQINDYFWFERDSIAEILGYESYEELMTDRGYIESI